MVEPQNPLGAIAPPPVGSAWLPLRNPLFRTLWVAAIISYIGTWMQNLGVGWLMTTLTTSPMMVGLVQAASSFPVFLVVLPAGALADIVDRRRLLLVTQSWMVAAAAALGVLTLLGAVSPWILLLLTFLLGLGAVLNDPAWQAITPEIVAAPQLTSAIALNSAGFNVARAIGPALGGLIIAGAGSGVAFLLNAISFFGVIVFLLRWQRPAHLELDRPRLSQSMADGFRHFRTSHAVKSVLVRTGVFSFFAAALWALLPLIARPHGSIGYGLLLGSFGFGAMCGAAVLPVSRRWMSVNLLVCASTAVFALVTVGLGRIYAFPVLCLILWVGGGCWIHILASLNVSAQTMSPPAMRARAISLYLLILQGGVAAGSATWGAVAAHAGLPFALLVAAVGLALGIASAARFPLGTPDFVLE